MPDTEDPFTKASKLILAGDGDFAADDRIDEILDDASRELATLVYRWLDAQDIPTDEKTLHAVQRLTAWAMLHQHIKTRDFWLGERSEVTVKEET
jgi:hypothetical protein